jgi:hypothetical protein
MTTDEPKLSIFELLRYQDELRDQVIAAGGRLDAELEIKIDENDLKVRQKVDAYEYALQRLSMESD